jgi:hypothetical protein
MGNPAYAVDLNCVVSTGTASVRLPDGMTPVDVARVRLLLEAAFQIACTVADSDGTG